ncbi:MAG TPA: hypothetical protein VF777_08835 [Phycisphaerales bacterium]
MNTSVIRMAMGAMALACATCQGQVVPKHRDLLVGLSAPSGSIYVVDADSGLIRGLLSGIGPSASWPPPTRGTGPGLAENLIKIITTRSGRILTIASSRTAPLLEIDPSTGNRSTLPVTVANNGLQTVVLTQVDQRILLLGNAGSLFLPNVESELFRVDLTTNSASRVLGALRGDGPVFGSITSVDLLDRHTAIASEFSATADSALYRVDLSTGDRSILSLLGPSAASRGVITGGVLSSTFTTFGPNGFGSGPIGNSASYPAGVLDGVVYSVISTQPIANRYYSGVVSVDTATGDRVLRLGYGLLNGNLVTAPPIAGLAIDLGSVNAINRGLNDELLIGEGFYPTRLLGWNPRANTGRIITDFAVAFPTAALQNARIRSIAIYTNCPADVNLDGVADDADFSPFAAAYSIGSCEDAAMPLPCPSDLNADGMVDDADFAIFMTGYDRLLCD